MWWPGRELNPRRQPFQSGYYEYFQQLARPRETAKYQKALQDASSADQESGPRISPSNRLCLLRIMTFLGRIVVLESAIIYSCVGVTDCLGKGRLSKNISTAWEPTIGFP